MCVAKWRRLGPWSEGAQAATLRFIPTAKSLQWSAHLSSSGRSKAHGSRCTFPSASVERLLLSSPCPPFEPALSATILLLHRIPVLWNEFYYRLETKREEKRRQKVSRRESCRKSVQAPTLSLLVSRHSPASSENCSNVVLPSHSASLVGLLGVRCHEFIKQWN